MSNVVNEVEIKSLYNEEGRNIEDIIKEMLVMYVSKKQEVEEYHKII